MKVTVFGLGHVGLVTAAVLAEHGHTVYGVECDPLVRELVSAGRAPFHEPGLDSLVKRNVKEGRLKLIEDVEAAVRGSQVSLVCVGTPQAPTGEVDLCAVKDVLRHIGASLYSTGNFHVVALRSTTPPTAWRTLERILSDGSGLTPGKGFGFCANPEFLREGQAVADFETPPFLVIGHDDMQAGYVLAALYGWLRITPIATTPETAMLLKYVCNTWHALKVAFANEVDSIARDLGINGGEVLAIFAQDVRLNISAAYLRPGGPYGGPCLPKDVAALQQMAERVGVPLLQAVSRSNRVHLNALVERALGTGANRFGVVGLSFKPGTSDIRDSPAAVVVEALLRAGGEVRIYDPDVPVSLAREFAAMLSSPDAMRGWVEAWVVCKPNLVDGRELQGQVVGWM